MNHIWVRWIVNIVSFSCVGLNIYFTILSWYRYRASKKAALASTWSVVPRLVEALTDLADHACPLCAQASGVRHGLAQLVINGHQLEPEATVSEEANCRHHVRGEFGEGDIPCLAAPARQLARHMVHEFTGG